ncbi:MAG: GTP-sensing pleiotropic transcriptional regulator CodY [Phascolarctobacterium sp.]|nr:GTP-sensing pleiotropic transcriptional regulator CodY [Phascolarctobacterium sp.]
MSLLEKTRKLSKLLQERDNAQYQDVANLMSDVIEANIYIVGNKGDVKGYSLRQDFVCRVVKEVVLNNGSFPAEYVQFLMGIKETYANIPHINQNCTFRGNEKCLFPAKKTTVVPIFGNGERLGTLIVAKPDSEFNDDDLVVAEYAATVLGVQILHEREARVQEETRKKLMVQIAFSTLSYSELEAIHNILGEVKENGQGLLVASKIADRVGITRSVIVNALRKFESADLIETRSLGMKGTFIKIKNEYLLEELNKH